MVAEIIPIKRLPRRFSHFDYAVPPELEAVIHIGQLVRIPLKSSDILGLVLSLKHESETQVDSRINTNLKSVTDIVNQTPMLSKAQLGTLWTLSSWYGVSTGTLAKMMLLPLQKRKLKSIELQQSNKATKQQSNDSTFFLYYTNESQHKRCIKELIRKSSNTQILILVPEIHHIDEILSLLGEHEQDITTWHSGLSTKEQFERWLQIRNGEKNIIIGTRGAILLPYFNLRHIVIDFEHKNNHKHWDQAPRFHVKDIADLLRTTQGVTVTLMSYTPSVETYFNVHKGNYTSKKIKLANLSTCKLVNVSDEHRGGNYSPISEVLEQALLHLKESAFLHLNRLGIATYIGCNDCGWRALCGTCKLPQILHKKNKLLTCHYCKTTNSLPAICPKCNARVVTLSGVGTETVESYMREFASKHNLPHDIVRIDSQAIQESKKTDKQIIVGTDAAFPHIDWKNTSLIALLDIDKSLTIPEFRAQEELWHTIQDIHYNKRGDATLIIQSRDPKHLVLKSLAEPDRFYRTDLNHRMHLQYPPYTYLVRYFYGHANLNEAKTVMETSVKILKHRILEQQKNIILSDSFDMHPHYFRGRYWFAVLARLKIDLWQEDLIWLNAHIPQTWKIDPNPISVLSP